MKEPNSCPDELADLTEEDFDAFLDEKRDALLNLFYKLSESDNQKLDFEFRHILNSFLRNLSAEGRTP